MKRQRTTCPCHSERPYAACCQPFHEGAARPERPAELMRSRYAAFALGRAPYLIETLAAAHPDRQTPEAAHVRELASIKDVRRFMGLRIYGEWVEGDRGEVLFAAKLFERGQNVGIVELSTFERTEGRWRYASGTLLRLADISSADLESLTRARFLALAEARAAR